MVIFIASLLVTYLVAPVISTGLAGGSVIRIQSPTRVYTTSSTLDEVIRGKRVAVISVSSAHHRYFMTCDLMTLTTDIEATRDMSRSLGHESWFPRQEDVFQIDLSGKRLACVVTRALDGLTLVQYVGSSPNSRSQSVADIGLSMLSIIEKLHKEHRYGLRTLNPDRWILRSNTDVRSLALVDHRHLRPLSKDSSYYHRASELVHLVMTLRYLVDLDPRFLFTKNQKVTGMDVSSPSHSLTALLVYALSINPDQGKLPRNVYGHLRDLLVAMRTEGRIQTSLASTGRVSSRLPGTKLQYLNPIVADQKRFHIFGKFGQGCSAIVLDAIEVDLSTTSGRPVALKCHLPDGEDDMSKEYHNLLILAEEPWVPQVRGMFTDESSRVPLQCFPMELLGWDLGKFSRVKGIMPFNRLMDMGLRMLDIIEKLHHQYRLVHRDLHPENWMLRDNSDLTSLVLIDYGNMRTIERDRSEYHRIRELRELVITLRFLRNLDKKYWQAKNLKINNIDIICPNSDICPKPLRDLIEYILTLDPERSHLSQDIYTTIRQHLSRQI